MSFTRVIRRWLSSGLVLAILFTQIATAAYACPATGAVGAGSVTTQAPMPCAGMMGSAGGLDAEQPGLCAQHCQFGNTQQPAGDATAVLAPLPALLALFTLRPTVAALSSGVAWAASARHRDRAPPLAHSIAHCCYRI